MNYSPVHNSNFIRQIYVHFRIPVLVYLVNRTCPIEHFIDKDKSCSEAVICGNLL